MGVLARIVRSTGLPLGISCALVVALCTWPAAGGGSRAQAENRVPLAVIVGRSSHLSDIDSGVLRSSFLGLPASVRGERLVPFNLPLGTPPRIRFDREVLGLTPDRVGMFWIDQRVRDGRQPPRTVPNPLLAVRVAASLRGAISYVPLPIAEAGPVRILRIDGRAPGESGYALP